MTVERHDQRSRIRVREAGIQPHHRSRTITPLAQIPAVKSGQQTAVQAYIAGDIAPRSKAETRKEAVSSTCPIISILVSLRCHLSAPLPSFKTRLRSSASLPFSAQNFLSGFSQKSHLPTPTTGSNAVVQQRTFCTSAKRFQRSSSAGPRGARPKLQAELDRRLLSPRHRSCELLPRMRLHDLKDQKQIDPSQPLPPTPAVPSPFCTSTT